MAFGHEGSLQKDGTRQGHVPCTTCCMYSWSKLPSHHLPRLFGSLVLVPAVLVFVLSIWVASRKTCCARLLPRREGGSRGSATLVVPGTELVCGSLELVPAVLVFILSIWVVSRTTCCTRLLPCRLGGSRGSATLVVPGTGLVCPSSLVLLRLVPSAASWCSRWVFSTAMNIPEARAGAGSRRGCGVGSQLRISLIAASVSGSLCPFLACPSYVCFGGGVSGAVGGGVLARGLGLGLVDEDEQLVEDFGLSVLLGVVPVLRGFVPRRCWGPFFGFRF